MDGVALQGPHVGRDGLQLQDRRPGRQAVAQVLRQRFALGVLEDEVGQFTGFRRPQRQIEGDGCHAEIVTRGRGASPTAGSAI